MEQGSKAKVMEPKSRGRYREKYSGITLALAVINRPGSSYQSNISRRQTKLTPRTESCVLRDLRGHDQSNVFHKAEQKQT